MGAEYIALRHPAVSRSRFPRVDRSPGLVIIGDVAKHYPLLSDSEHRLVDALKLPLLEVAGHPPRIKRATLIVDHERVVREVMYPVPDPGANAAEAMAAVAKRVGG